MFLIVLDFLLFWVEDVELQIVMGTMIRLIKYIDYYKVYRVYRLPKKSSGKRTLV